MTLKTFKEIIQDYKSWSQHDENILKQEVIHWIKQFEKIDTIMADRIDKGEPYDLVVNETYEIDGNYLEGYTILGAMQFLKLFFNIDERFDD